jgi:integrase
MGGRRNHHTIFGAKLFRQHLVEIGVCRSAAAALRHAEPCLVAHFKVWLRKHRGASDPTIKLYARDAAHLMAALGDDPERREPAAIRSFFLDRASHCGNGTVEKLTTRLLNAEYLLKSFATFATERGQTHVHTQTAIDWAARGPSVAQRDARLKAVCRFVRHVRVEDARHELPPVNHFGARKTRRSPHIYSAAEIDRLIEAALRLRPKGGLRSRTYATLIALLSVTGLRISEALKLTVADVTRDGLLIRETKFRKTRLVPLHDTAERA